MILDHTVCARIASQWPTNDEGLFDAPWANLVAQWCVDYFERYDQPPRNKLRAIYNDWAETTPAPDDTVEGVERFLRLADEEWERAEDETINSDFILDRANRYFNEVRTRRVLDKSGELLDINRVGDAQAELINIKPVELATDSTISVATDYDAFRKAWDTDQTKSLVPYPGFAHEFIGQHMKRDTLIGFMAPDKTGKSVWLLDLAVRAMNNRKRVLFIDSGDNSQDQVLRRLGSRVARIPSAETIASDGKHRIPMQIRFDEDDDVDVKYEVRKYDEPVTAQQAYSQVVRLCRGIDRLKIKCVPNSSLSVAGIEAEVQRLDMMDWHPDVIVIDYADILAPPTGVRDTLDQIDVTWKQLRRLSSERHCLVVTATQGSSSVYTTNGGPLRKQHFSGRKTKLAHVNGMIGINLAENDRDKGISRLNWVVRREGRYSESKQLIVAGCWDWYSPVYRSTYK
jgi:hypothetical protein